MRVPLGWLADMIELPDGITAEKVAAELVSVGLEEEGLDTGDLTGPLVVGHVLSVEVESHKNGKTIRWCSVDVGAHHAAEGGGPRGIVCGAPNISVGDLVVVALPGAVLPGGFEIAARRTYGHVSDGMVCSAKELDLGDDHTGIIVLSTLGLQAEPGTDAIGLLRLDEATIEVNVTPDRGYCFSMRGIAREYAHATGRTDRYRDPADLYRRPSVDAAPTVAGYPVRVDDTAPIEGAIGCDRFVARIVRGVDPTAPTPFWMQRRLQQSGMRPISLAVDVTNYVMLGLGQPLHAYDLATLGEAITVRRAGAGEQLVTLDGVRRDLHAEDLLITDGPEDGTGERVIGLAGVMGGATTEVSASTTDVLVEAAHFDPISVARTARRHRLPSEASKRFERGVDPRVSDAAAEWVVRLLVELGGGTSDERVTDLDETRPPGSVEMPADLPARLVGVGYDAPTVVGRLSEIGCRVEHDGPLEPQSVLTVWPPTWRPDLRVGADLVEEVARLEGYGAIPSVLPRAPGGRGFTDQQRRRRSVSRALSEAGWVEVLSYPFVSDEVNDVLGLPDDDPRRVMVRLANPLSEEAPHLRTSLLQSMLEVLRRNVSRGATDLAVYEVGTVTRPTRSPEVGDAARLTVQERPSDDDLDRQRAAVPPQPLRVAGLAAGRFDPVGWWGPGRVADHADAVQAARTVADELGVDLVVAADTHEPWHPGRCAVLRLPDGTLVGHAGELHPAVCERAGLPARTVAFEMDLGILLAAASAAGPVQVQQISTYPVVKEDVALVVPDSVPAGEVEQVLRAAGGDLLEDVRLFDVYSGEQVPAGHRSLAFALRMRAPDRTLTADESATVRRAVVEAAVDRFGAVLRGV